MCLYPKLIRNPKYRANKKNKGIIPPMEDERIAYVPVGCGKCMECMKRKSREWQVRLNEEIRDRNDGQFITFTFSNKNLIKLSEEVQRLREDSFLELHGHDSLEFKLLDGYDLENAIVKLAVRRFLERWRKKFKKSVRHWFVSELGHENTERIHIHGLLFTDATTETIENIWQYGNIWIGDYVNEKTINYIVKYIHKLDQDHKYYKPVILTSAGIGSGYLKRKDSNRNKYNYHKTNELYTTRNGIKLPLPIYYRNKIYSDEERENLWLNLLDKNERYVNGIKVDVSINDEDYIKLLLQQRKINEKLGYGNDETDEEQEAYERQLRNLKRLQIQNELK